jgi:hypothetical protein
MTTEEIIDKITSRDTHNVWSSACEIISWGQNHEKILPLINYLPAIKEKTKELDLGGAIAPNQRFIDFAIRTIEFHRDNKECSCNLFLEHSIEPKKEKEKGNITIINEKVSDCEIDYNAKCLKCNQIYNINQNDAGHTTWYTWKKLTKE